MLRYLRGAAEIEVTGASPVLCLNRWTQADLPFWKLSLRSELVLRCRVYEAQLPRIQREAARAWCEVRVLRRLGLPRVLRRLRGRPALTFGLPLVLLLSWFLQNFVWFLQIRGNDRVSEETILRALEAEGLSFGSWGPSIDSEDLKNRVLNRVPELRWLAVNREGGVVTVLTAEREPETPTLDETGICNIVAARPGVIREISVDNGFAMKEPGDVVLEGEILISGVMEWPVRVQATRARGEVRAETLRLSALVCPAKSVQKTYTGRTETCVTIILERKRRKISGNSSIFGTMCDRMIETRTWTLPGGWTLPVAVEILTLREYAFASYPLSPEEAESLLRAESLRLTERQMVAGTVETGSVIVRKTQDSYVCRGVWNCLEVISVTRPAELFGEEEQHGETDQRGTD